MKRYRVGVVNPIPRALAYYGDVLKQHLRWISVAPVAVNDVSIEELGLLRKLSTVCGALVRRARVPDGVDSILVVWPAFGYLDVLTWWRVARRVPVSLVVHDVDPLRRQFGYGKVAMRIFTWIVRRGNFRVITHTMEAAERLQELTHVRADVIPHPINRETALRHPVEAPAQRRLLVLGQFKEARSIDAMQRLAAGVEPPTVLRAVGRGWPPIPGWEVVSAFVSEEEFDAELRRADAIMLPYSHYQQSGVMVRAFELGVPVVGLRHVQLEQLYGHTWPGIVEGADWVGAVGRVLDGDLAQELLLRRERLTQEIDRALLDHIRRGEA